MEQSSEDLLKAMLTSAGAKTVVLAMGSPYLASDYPEVQNYLCLYSTDTVSEISAVKAIFGEIAVRGNAAGFDSSHCRPRRRFAARPGLEAGEGLVRHPARVSQARFSPLILSVGYTDRESALECSRNLLTISYGCDAELT